MPYFSGGCPGNSNWFLPVTKAKGDQTAEEQWPPMKRRNSDKSGSAGLYMNTSTPPCHQSPRHHGHQINLQICQRGASSPAVPVPTHREQLHFTNSGTVWASTTSTFSNHKPKINILLILALYKCYSTLNEMLCRQLSSTLCEHYKCEAYTSPTVFT